MAAGGGAAVGDARAVVGTAPLAPLARLLLELELVPDQGSLALETALLVEALLVEHLLVADLEQLALTREAPLLARALGLPLPLLERAPAELRLHCRLLPPLALERRLQLPLSR